ncbi:nuclear transport factor 2 family protein [Myxococcota bacterium]|nr:nuclear transport factor 2 family protein [Myxococcota bacterium]
MESEQLSILLAEREITRVVLRYARAVDTLDFDQVRECFHPDARVTYGKWFSGDLNETIAWLSDSLPRLQSTLHDFGTPWIEFNSEGNAATCETYTTNSARYPEDENGQVILNVSGTRYLDQFEQRGGIWRILERRNMPIWSLNTPEVPNPPPPYERADVSKRRPLRTQGKPPSP